MESGELFNMNSVKPFIDILARFLLIIVWVLQGKSGSPDLITKLSDMHVKKSPSSAQNVFILEGKMMFTWFYRNGREEKDC